MGKFKFSHRLYHPVYSCAYGRDDRIVPAGKIPNGDERHVLGKEAPRGNVCPVVAHPARDTAVLPAPIDGPL